MPPVHADGEQPHAGVPRLLWALLLLAMGTMLAAYSWQGRQLPCGDALAPAPGWHESGFWLCPYELHRHGRRVGSIGDAWLNDAWFAPDGSLGLVATQNGTVIGTRDGGRSWQTLGASELQPLEGLAVSGDRQRGWAVGSGGAMMATRDGGQTWRVQGSGTKEDLRSVVVAGDDGQRAWAVGRNGTVVATLDGGQTWQPQPSGTSSDLESVVFHAEGLRGFAAGEDGTLITTRDGGRRWQLRDSGTKNSLEDLAFDADGQRGWAVGAGGAVVATRDGGETWFAQSSGVSETLEDVAFAADGLRGWAVGEAGVVISTRDGGQSWQRQDGGTRALLEKVVFEVDGRRGWAFGQDGTVIVTHDGGTRWRVLASHQRVRWSGVAITPDGERGWVIGSNGTVIGTRDGGRRWRTLAAEPQRSQAPQDPTPRLSFFDMGRRTVRFLPDGQRGWMLDRAGVVSATRDGGQSWQVQSSGAKPFVLQDLVFNADGLRGWAVGEAGAVMATRDGGQTWSRQTSGTQTGLLSVVFNGDGQRGWAFGWAGTVIATRDGGQAWQDQSSGIGQWLQSAALSADGQRAWAVGGGGTVIATRDAGQTWQTQASGTTAWLQGVVFSPDGQRGWAVGSNGTVIATRDGGQHWQSQRSGTQALLANVAFSADGQRGWAVGSGGTIIATRDGGLSWQPQAEYRRYPAPWFAVLAAVLLAAVLAPTVQLLLRPPGTATKRIVSRAVPDEPISRADQDRLGFTPIVEGLAAYLRHVKTRPPVVLAITAPWGRGKSSMMRMLRTQLERHGMPVCWFNAWHHQKEPVLMAALLSAVVQQSVPSWFSLRGLRFRSRLVWRRWWRRPLLGLLPALLWFGALLALAISAVGAVTAALAGEGARGVNPVFGWWADHLHAALGWITGNKVVESLTAGEWSRFAREMLAAVGQDPAKSLPLVSIAAALATLFFLFTYYSRAFPANPSALLASLGTNRFSLSQAEAQTGFRDRFREHFRDVTEALQPRTLTVFIDDLDRCSAANSAEVLEAVNYLTDSGQCFVVLGISRDIVEAQLGDAYDSLAQRTAEFERVRIEQPAVDTGNATTGGQAAARAKDDAAAALAAARVRLNYARNYLRKLIQVEVPVPAFGRTQAHAMAVDDGQADPATRQRQRSLLVVERRWQRCFELRSLASALLGLLVPALALVWLLGQAWNWSELTQKAFDSERSRSQERLDGARALLDPVRRYAAYLRLDVDALVSQYKGAAAAAPQGDAVLALADRQAHLARVEAGLADADRLLQRMQGEVEQRQPKAALDSEAAIRAKAGGLLVLREQDPRHRERIDEQSRRLQAASAQQPAGKQERPPLPREPAGTGAPVAATQPQWPLILPLLLLPLPVLLLLARPRRLQIQESQHYRDASGRWAGVVTAIPEQQAPRELVRFLNLSRYLAVRLHPGTYVPLPWLKKRLRTHAGLPATEPVAQEDLPEPKVVALTSLYLARPAEFRNGNAKDFLAHPLAALQGRPAADPQGLLGAAIAMALGSATDACDEDRPPWTDADVKRFLAACGEIRIDEAAPAPQPAAA